MSKTSLSTNSSGIPLNGLLILPFVIQTVAAVGLVGYLSFLNGQRAVNELASQLRQEISERVREKILEDMGIPHGLNGITAGLIESGVIPLENIRKLEQHFWKLIPAPERITTTFISRPDGSVTGARWVGNQLVFDTATRTYAVKPDGTRGELLGVYPDYDPRERPWYQKAVASKRATWSEIYVDYNTNTLGITAVQPIYDERGNLEGVLGSGFLLTTVNKFMRELEVGKTGTAFVVEPSGYLVTSSSDTPLQIKEGEKVKRLLAIESEDSIIRETTRHLMTEFLNLNAVPAGDQKSFSLNGERLFLQITPIQDVYGLNWLLITVLPEQDFMAQIIENNRTTLYLILLALTIAILTGMLSSRWITKPLLRLVDASDAMAMGRMGQEVPPTSIRELRGLGEAFNSMAKQLQESLTSLEQKVQERTEELQVANAQILSLNDQLHEENLRMGSELEIARQLQQAILPRPLELEGIVDLDIAGFMEPAVEVGGDYYDVLKYNNTITVGIGDVTGHGLESGILSIMVQSVVRALAIATEIDTKYIIDILNRTIYDNIQRMETDKNLSFLLLHYHEGKFLISGQHESIILVRENGDLELIDTDDLGFPIGLEPEIEPFINSYERYLAFGDILVLYTDGIPEAVNASGEHYGLERLCITTQIHRHLSSSEIRDAIVLDFREYVGDWIIYDDITLVVLKRLQTLDV